MRQTTRDSFDGFMFEDDFWNDAIPNSSWEDDEEKLGQALRDRALQALNMEVVEEDALRSELRRTEATNPDPDNPFFSLKFLSSFGVAPSPKEENLGTLPFGTLGSTSSPRNGCPWHGTSWRRPRRGDFSIPPEQQLGRFFLPSIVLGRSQVA